MELQNTDLRWPEGELLCPHCSIELFFHQFWQTASNHYLSGHVEVATEVTLCVRRRLRQNNARQEP